MSPSLLSLTVGCAAGGSGSTLDTAALDRLADGAATKSAGFEAMAAERPSIDPNAGSFRPAQGNRAMRIAIKIDKRAAKPIAR